MVPDLEKLGEDILFQELLSRFLEYGEKNEGNLLQQAFEMGKKYHHAQKRESGVAYFTHPLLVAMLMIEYKPDVFLLIATMLHDAVEDCKTEFPNIEKEIVEVFGSDVLHMIDGVSKVESVQKDKTISKRETLKKLFQVTSKDVRSLVIKIFDRTHNILTLFSKKDPQKRSQKIEETLRIYVPCAEYLGLWHIKKILEDACTIILAPKESKDLQESIENNTLIKTNITEFFLQSFKNAKIHAVDYALSTIIKKHEHVSQFKDFAAESTFFIECITPNSQECEKLYHALIKKLPEKPGSYKNYIMYPKAGGYQSIHCVVVVQDSFAVSVKITSQEMQKANHYGVFQNLWSNDYSFLLLSEKKLEVLNTSSERFLDHLANDFLAEKITVHSPEKGEIQVPKSTNAAELAILLYPNQWQMLQYVHINGSKEGIFSILNERDIVKFTWDSVINFRREWKNYINNPTAKDRMNEYLEKNFKKEEKIQKGKIILQELFDEEKLGNIDTILLSKPEILDFFTYSHPVEMYQAIFEGYIKPFDVLQKFWNLQPPKNQGFFKKFWNSIPWVQKHQQRLIISFQIKKLSKTEQEKTIALIKKRCIAENVTIETFQLSENNQGTKGSIELKGNDHKDLMKVFLQLNNIPHVIPSLAPPFSFLLKIFTFAISPLIITIFFYTLLLHNNSVETIIPWFFYGTAVVIAICNALGYSFIAQYYSFMRYNIPLLFTFIVVNIIATGSYALLLLYKHLDPYHLGIFFVLLVVLIAIAFPILLFRKDESLVKETTYSLEEYKQKQKQKIWGYIIRLGAVFIWGMRPILFKYTPISEVDVHTRTLLNFLGGFITCTIAILVLKYWGSKKNWNPRMPINRYFIFIVITLIFLIYFAHASLMKTSGTNFILLNNFAPIFALLIAAVFWKDKILYLQKKSNEILIFIIFFIGGIGSSFLFFNDIKQGIPGSFYGNMFAIGYMLLDVFFTIAMIQYAKQLKDYQSYFLNFYTYIIGMIIVSIPIFLFFSDNLFSYQPKHYFSIIGTGMFLGVGMILSYEAFRRMDGYIAFLMFNISIFITFVTEAFILHQIKPTVLLVIGGILIIGSSVLAEFINTKCEKEKLR